MKVVPVSAPFPTGPSSLPDTVNRSQATEFGATNAGSDEALFGPTNAQTVLLSLECCQVARIAPGAITAGLVLFSNGLGLKKWVMICRSAPLNRVASGVKRTYPPPPLAVGAQT